MFVTSQGSAYTRFQRALSTGNPHLIRAAAAELSRIDLRDALAISLVLLDREPQAFSRAATRWAGRLALEHPVCLTDAQLTLCALRALADGHGRAGAEALRELCERFGLAHTDELLLDWLDRRGLGD